MTIEELKDDSRFEEYPQDVLEYMEKHADKRCNVYVGFVEIVDGDVVQRTFACKLDKFENLMKTEVERKSIECKKAITRNIYLTEMSGYRPVYEKKDVYSSGTWYGYHIQRFYASDWNYWVEYDSPMGLYNPVINLEKFKENEAYKYCGYQSLSLNGDLIEYLRKYKDNKSVEYFGKLGLKPAPSLVSRASKDKQFARFVVDNAENVRKYGPQATVRAYLHKETIAEAHVTIDNKRRSAKAISNHAQKLMSANIDKEKLIRYILRNKISAATYFDYFDACEKLDLDMKDTKNSFPIEFARMHDLRTQQYASKKAKERAETQKELDKKFNRAAKKYIPFEQNGEKYAIVIPRHIDELVYEGALLHHCVGDMGYDLKMAEGRSAIGFVRKMGELDKPFATFEFADGKIEQLNGDYHSYPGKEIEDMVKQWAQRVNKKIKTAM